MAIGFALVATLVALGVGLAPGLLSGVLAERLGRTIGTDVRLGWITWNPFRGRWTVRSVRVAADRGPAAFAARRVALQFRVWDLIRGRHRLASTAIDRARVRLRATEDGWALPLPARATAETGSDASSVFQLDAIEAPG